MSFLFEPFRNGDLSFLKVTLGLILIFSPISNVAGQLPVTSISTNQSPASVDSHPYSVLINESSSLGYIAVCGDVAPFGEPASDFSNNQIVEFDALSLNVTRTFTVGYFPTEMVISGQDLWVSCSTEHFIYRINLATGNVTSIEILDAGGLPVTYLSGLATGSDGKIYLASNGGSFDGSSQNVVSVNPSTNSIDQRYTITGGISKITVLDDGTLVVPVAFPGDDFTAPPVLLWIDSVSGEVLTELLFDVDTADFPAPSDLVEVGDGSALLTIFGGNSVVYRIDLLDRLIIDEYVLPDADTVQTAVVVDSEDTFLVAHYFMDRLSRIDMTTGQEVASLQGVGLPNDVQIFGGRIFTANQASELVSVHVMPDSFLRSDVNHDGGIDIGDAIGLLQFLFLGGSIACLDSGDVNDDGTLDLGDPIQLLSFLFSGGGEPFHPFPFPGADVTEDALDCF